MQDPIADMLTRIRNGQAAKKMSVTMPSSSKKIAIAKVLEDEGYIAGYSVSKDGVKATLQVDLKYYQGKPVIARLERVSKPGLRVYRGKNDIPEIMGGLGVAIVSTTKGVMSARAAKAQNFGGEVICVVE
jgi:small subunit ribosomal protein S8